MKHLQKRRNIDKATSFKVEYVEYLNDRKHCERLFNNIKSLNQWIDRNDNGYTIGLCVTRKLALIDGTWEPFTTIGKKTITLSDLKFIVSELEVNGDGGFFLLSSKLVHHIPNIPTLYHHQSHIRDRQTTNYKFRFLYRQIPKTYRHKQFRPSWNCLIPKF